MGTITQEILEKVGVWWPLQSSFLESARWTPSLNLFAGDDASIIGTLEVSFKGGGRQEYLLGLGTFLELISAGSPGAYFNQFVKGRAGGGDEDD